MIYNNDILMLAANPMWWISESKYLFAKFRFVWIKCSTWSLLTDCDWLTVILINGTLVCLLLCAWQKSWSCMRAIVVAVTVVVFSFLLSFFPSFYISFFVLLILPKSVFIKATYVYAFLEPPLVCSDRLFCACFLR